MIHATNASGCDIWDIVCIYAQPSRVHHTQLLMSVTNPILCFSNFNDLLHSRDKWGGLQVKMK